jgi:serine/threonine protein kinase
MMTTHWKIVTPSQFEHERRALDFVRADLPDHEPYRAWANFEFQSGDGALYEVDLLVLGREGFWLVEIKSRPGKVEGDVGTWTWTTPEGRRFTDDNPIYLANKKAKALSSLLKAQAACRAIRVPFLEPLIFLSVPELQCDLAGAARNRVCLTDRHPDDPLGPRDGILAALLSRKVGGVEPNCRSVIDAKVARVLTRAMDEAGIRPSQRERRVGDYFLGDLLVDGPGYQDRVAKHVVLQDVTCRARQYLVARAASEDRRQQIRRAAEREFRLLQGLEHPNILRVNDFKVHEYGPVLTFQHDPQAVRLDHFLRADGARLTAGQRLELLRQLADALRYAQAHRVIHRGLAPQSVLVTRVDSDTPAVKVFNWQVGVRDTETASSGTTHVEELVEDKSLLYLAPEAGLTPKQVTPAADVFSLGAIAFHLFAGRPPAASLLERANHLREHKGFNLAAVLDGAGPKLCELVRYATHPDVGSRIQTAEDFLVWLAEVEDELTAPEGRQAADPDLAQKGDELEGGFVVERILGQGSTGKALLVTRGNEEFVLKVARTEEDNARLREEAEVLRKLRSEFIVGLHEVREMHGRTVLVLDKAGDETLASYLRQEGKCGLEWLERFGADLLAALESLDRHGIVHRDIKPDNVALRGGKQRKQLVLFDFSLARAPVESLQVGTRPYLDPFLSLRKPPRWDPAAECYAAAVTLYEMAAGWQVYPKWGDGQSDPALTDDELTIEADLFDPVVRDGLCGFFLKALQRDPAQRFHNAETMKRAWEAVFRAAERQAEEVSRPLDLEQVRLDTSVEALGLSTRARNALERINVATVREFLSRSVGEFQFMRGVGNKTRKDIIGLLATLRERFPDVPTAVARDAEAAGVDEDVAQLGLHALRQRLVGAAPTGKDRRAWEIRNALLGLDSKAGDGPAWPTQNDVADRMGVSRQRISQVLTRDRMRWARDGAVTALREELVAQVYAGGGTLTGGEVIDVLLARRNLDQLADADRPYVAAALARVALEAEQAREEPRLVLRRVRASGRVLFACTPERADQVERLGEIADELAAEDPLPPPARALQRLQEIAAPSLPDGCTPFGNDRLLRLAVAVSRTAALSPRQEVYPRGMPAGRALKLGLGALTGLGLGESFPAEDVRQRIAARYPEAETLPERPALDEMLKVAGLELTWDDAAGGYRRPSLPGLVSTGTSYPPRLVTTTGSRRPPVTPEVADARQFEERLSYTLRDGGFLVLTVLPRDMPECERQLVRQFGVERVSLDALLLKHLGQQAVKQKVKSWQVVLGADGATPDSRGWQNLQRLVKQALPGVEAELLGRGQPTLLVHPGLLARYDILDLLERLRDKVGRPGQCPALWLLVAADEQCELPMLDGHEIPLLTPGQRTAVPRSWVLNFHRGAAVAS